MKKVCFIIDSMKNSGGRERVISILSKTFLERYDVEVLVLDDVKTSFYKLDDRIKIINLVEGKTNKIDKIKKLHKYFKQNSDYIYISLSMRFLNLFIGAAAVNTKAKIIATEHCDYLTTPKMFRGLKHIFYRKFKYVVTLTDKDKDLIGSWFKNVVRIINPSSFRPEKGSEYNNRTILNVGRLTEQKGQDMLLKAWKKTDKKDWKLRIVGDGELKGYLNDLIKELNIQDSVEIMEPTNKIEEVYINSDIFVLSSRWEGLPMVLIEAMSCGLPCISFDCETGPRQLIKDGVSGYLVEPDNINQLAEYMGKMIANNEMIIKMGENSKIEAEKYSIEKIKNYWFDLIENI